MPMFKLHGKDYAFDRKNGKTVFYEVNLKPVENITPEMVDAAIEIVKDGKENNDITKEIP